MLKKNKLQKVIVAICCSVISLNLVAENLEKSQSPMKAVQQKADVSGDVLAKPEGSTLRIASYNVFRTRIFKNNREESFKRLHNALQPEIWLLNEMFYSDDPAPESEGDAFLQHVKNFTGESDWNYSWDAKGRYLLSKYNIVWSQSVGRRTHVTWIDLPSSVSSRDLLVINVHFMKDSHGQETRDFIRQVRAGTYRGANIPKDISIIVGGDFNASRGHARYNYIADEGFSDPIPLHIGTNLDNTFGDSNLSGGELVGVLGNDIDFILHQSDVMDCVKSFIPNTLILDQAILDKYGLRRGDVAKDPDGNHDYINGRIACDHYPQVADFYESTEPLANNAEFVSQSVPQSMAPGEIINVSLTMKNTGTDSWTNAAEYKLGSKNPQGNSTWGFNRVDLADGESVAPGSEKTFNFEITAPDTDGTFNFQWQMVQEYVAFFGAISPNKEIIVGEGGVETTVAIASPADKSSFDSATGFTVSVDASHSSGFEWMRLWVDAADIEAYVYELKTASPWEFNVSGLSAGTYTFHVRARDNDGGTTDSESITVMLTDDVASKINSLSVSNVSISPNPVYDNGVRVEFGLKSLSKVSLSVLNMNGTVVSQPITNKFFQSGEQRVDIPLGNVLPGTYFLKILIDGTKQVHKIIVM